MELREALESAVSAHEARQSEISEAPAEAVVESAPTEPVETAEQKADRLRDEKGRFVEGKAEPKVEVKAETPAPVVEAKPRPAKPSSWKKDFSEHWDKLDPAVAEYIHQREGEYAKGVSTYKQEWDNAKPLIDAVAPFLPVLQQNNIKPDQWISNLGKAHHALATGDGQTKLQMFAKLAQDYGVPLQALYDPAYAQQFVSQQIARPQPVQQPQDVGELVRKELSAARLQDSIEQFQAAKDATGNPLYPHFETVKTDMALLLEAGKAQDLKTAYSKALRLHDDIWEAEQASKRQSDDAAKLEAQRKATAAAKASAVSVKSATPASAGAQAKKGIRATLEEAYDQHATGRV